MNKEIKIGQIWQTPLGETFEIKKIKGGGLDMDATDKECPHCGAVEDRPTLDPRDCGKRTPCQVPALRTVLDACEKDMQKFVKDRLIYHKKSNCHYGFYTPENICSLIGPIDPFFCQRCKEWTQTHALAVYEVSEKSIKTMVDNCVKMGSMRIPMPPILSESIRIKDFAEVQPTDASIPLPKSSEEFKQAVERYVAVCNESAILNAIKACDVGGPNCKFCLADRYFHDVLCTLVGFCGPCRKQCLNKEYEVDAN